MRWCTWPGKTSPAGRWTAEHKARIRDSRVRGHLAAGRGNRRPARGRPRVMVSASGINVYGTARGRGRRRVDAAGRRLPGRGGHGLGGGGRARCGSRASGWPIPASQRCSIPSDGRARPAASPPFRAGVGGPLGSGKQPFSWVALDDAVGAIHHALMDDALAGPFNVASPTPAEPGGASPARWPQVLEPAGGAAGARLRPAGAVRRDGRCR